MSAEPCRPDGLVTVDWEPATGFAVLGDLLAESECEEVVALCRDLFAQPETAHPRDKAFSGTRHLEALDTRIPLVAEVVARPPLIELLAAMTGQRSLRPSQVSLRSPQPGYGGQDLHRDTVDAVGSQYPDAVTAIIALVDFTADNGATRLVPGSHLTGEPARRYRGRQAAANEITLTGSAGTAFVFSGYILHSGTQNNSDQERPALQVLWR